MATIAEALQAATRCLQSGQLEQAATIAQRITQADPQHVAAWQLLGMAAESRGRHREAAEHFERADRLRPDDAHNLCNLAVSYTSLGRLEEALSACRRAIALDGELPAAYYNLGNALRSSGQLAAAAEAYRGALARSPEFLGAWANLGVVLKAQGDLDEAVSCYHRALALDPRRPEVLNNLALALQTQGRLAQAVATYRQALAIDPGDLETHSNYLLAMNYDPAVDAAALFDLHRTWGQRVARGAAAHQADNDPDPQRPLRVGYLAADLPRHAMFIESFLVHHRAEACRVWLYLESPLGAAQAERLAGAAVRVIGRLSHAEVARQIIDDGIDVLVDLTGHGGRNRLPALALRPAPVQVSYLGYPCTTGLAAVDAFFSDATCAPPDEPPPLVEEVVRLPGGFSCYAPPPAAPAANRLPARSRPTITFGALHALPKLNGEVLDLWAELLGRVPHSRLLIGRDTLRGTAAGRLHDEFLRRGLDAERLELRSGVVAGDHWRLYHEIDVALDCFPWSGHTTACEALWMGVPVVTLRGTRHAGRMVASVLQSVGHPEWIADSREGYLAIAAELAGNLDRLEELRGGLREAMAGSPLCDGPRFTCELEAAYRRLWQTWCAKRVAEPPP